MARANNGGWDFVEEGKEYQYKEGGLIATVLVLEDNSDEKKYEFTVKVMEANQDVSTMLIFSVMQVKGDVGYWNDMPQFYKEPEYIVVPLNKDGSVKPLPFSYREEK